ncbi:hypothetical protein E2C01_057780 [Portunus trituberculatus]|uniref:Uncharacterized protein n=1 Tax=Portunus trituberculatus TaxID=210409 RepID=A0A5B7H3J6_PORTR|nr:hypothetical protein [Portunus trituberculatus]
MRSPLHPATPHPLERPPYTLHLLTLPTLPTFLAITHLKHDRPPRDARNRSSMRRSEEKESCRCRVRCQPSLVELMALPAWHYKREGGRKNEGGEESHFA